MKTPNYLAKLPQEATIKSIQVLKDYDLITLDVPTASQRLCPHCGSNDCVIKDSGTLQTIRHIPCNHGSKAFSGVSPQFPGVLYSFTSLFRRTPYFPGVSLNLLPFLVFTRFYWSSPLFTGVPNSYHQLPLKLHQAFLKLLIALIAMLDASIVVPAIQ